MQDRRVTENPIGRGVCSMSNSRPVSIGVLCTIFLAAAFSVVRAADQPPAVGTVAPDFQLPSQEGAPMNLSDFRGKWVVLYFYPKDFTKGCTIEAHNFQRDL